MNQRKFLMLALAVLAGIFLFYLYGGSATPQGQQPLVRLDAANLASFKDAFSGSANSVRVLVLVSPT